MTIENRYQCWIERILKIYVILMVFIIPQLYTNYVIWGCIFSVLIIYAVGYFDQTKSFRINIYNAFIWSAIFLVILINLFFSEYSTSRMIQNTFQLLIVYIAANDNYIKVKRKGDWFFWIFSSLLLANMLIDFAGNNVLTFTNFADQNYAAVIVFLYLLYSIHGKHIIGICISIFYAYMTTTRLYIIALFICIVVFFIDFFNSRRGSEPQFYSRKQILKLIGFLFVITIIFSLIWSIIIVGVDTTTYKQSFNDTSNAIRSNSNLYAFHLIMDDPKLIWRGYDIDIRTVLGISSDNMESHTTYMGYRVVQPHNSYLNPLITHGIIYTVLYFIVIANILSKHISNKNRILWLPYMIAALFMHSFFSSFYLIFWSLIFIPQSSEYQDVNIIDPHL